MKVSEDYRWRHHGSESCRVRGQGSGSCNLKRYGTQEKEELNWMYDIFTQLICMHRTLGPP